MALYASMGSAIGLFRGVEMQEYAEKGLVLCKDMRLVWGKGGVVSGKSAYLFKKGLSGHRKGLF